MRNLIRLCALTSLLIVATASQAALIRVSQETGVGTGDFDANVLGTIESYSSGGLTIADYYKYGNPDVASYNGPNPLPVSSLTQSFFVEASDGLHLVVVHDNPNDGSGGRTRMTTVLAGGAGGSGSFTVGDDPGEGLAISDVGSDRIFDTRHGWAPCCTDGYAIGALSAGDVLFAEFDELPTGITDWQASGNTLGNISLVLNPGVRVRFDNISVPEPGSIALLMLGLAAIGFSRRRA